jgi:hypothetical protein
MEEWRKIPGYEVYEVSNLGNVRRDGRVIVSTISKGYRMITTSVNRIKKKIKIARAVCLAFHPPVEGKTTVDHINRDKLDDRAENLKWADHTEQIINQTKPLPRSGHRNIYLVYNKYNVAISRYHIRYDESFKTLTEAIQARDKFLQNINT